MVQSEAELQIYLIALLIFCLISALFIVLFPLIFKHSKVFGYISLGVGVINLMFGLIVLVQSSAPISRLITNF